MDRRESEYEQVMHAGRDAYDAVYDVHARVYLSAIFECKCGRVFYTSQGLGLHLGAVRRQADAAMAVAMDAKRAELKAARDAASDAFDIEKPDADELEDLVIAKTGSASVA